MQIPIDLPAGVVATPTKAKNSSFWRETNLIRWDNGVMLPFDGWEQSALSLADTSEILRAIHVWSDNSGKRWIAYLSETKVYVEFAGVLYDISPTVPLVPPDYSTGGAGGYGDGPYGDHTYGTPRLTDGPERNYIGPCFKMDNWGEDLRVMSSADGRLLSWTPNFPVTNICVPVTNAPSGRTFIVTPERHIMIFQAGGDPSKYAWSDQEDDTEWTISPTTKAGNYVVEPGGPIIAAINTPNGNILWTDKHLTVSRYVGLPFIYSKEPAGTMTTPVSSMSVIKTDNGAMWFTEAGVYEFNGVNVVPVPCSVWAWVLENVDWPTARIHAFAMSFATKSEVMFFFPSTSGGYNDRYILYSQKYGWWAMGKMARSAGFSDNFIDFPVLADKNKIYVHGKSTQYPNAVELPWAETFVLNVDQGSHLATVRYIVPEAEGDTTNLRYSLAYNIVRAANSEQLTAKRTVQPSGWVEFMQSGRDFRLRVENISAQGGEWTMGPVIVDIIGRGVREK